MASLQGSAGLGAASRNLERERQRLADERDYHDRRYAALGEWRDMREAHERRARIFDIDEKLRETP
jgi:hypothetical protein